MNTHPDAIIFQSILAEVKEHGHKVAPRGMEIIEVENFEYELPPYTRFMSFKSRKLKIDYIKKEMLWYLKGDRFDVSIVDHAVIWKEIINVDGSFNSNYGQYVFGEQNQFDRIVDLLRQDKDSRRASIILLSKEHIASDTKDVPCTYAMNFRIRNNKLNMTVRMRSQDAVFGMGNDTPTFSIMHEMMYNALLEFYPELEYGTYHHSADSFHVYQRHYPVLEAIANGDEYTPVACPKINGPAEVRFLRAMKFSEIPDEFAFTRWLTHNNDNTTQSN